MKKLIRSRVFALLLFTSFVSTAVIAEGKLLRYFVTADRFSDQKVPEQMDPGIFVITGVSSATATANVITTFQLASGLEVEAPAHDAKERPAFIETASSLVDVALYTSFR